MTWLIIESELIFVTFHLSFVMTFSTAHLNQPVISKPRIEIIIVSNAYCW